MKKIFSFMLSVLVIAVMISSMSVGAYADISNVIKTGGGSFAEAEPAVGYDALEKLLEDCKVEQLPAKSSYLEECKDMYMDSGKTAGAHAYIKPNAKASKIVNIYQGMPVQLFAVEGDWGCVSFYDHQNEKKAGWVYLENLSEKYPGETVVFGKKNLDNCEYAHGAELVEVQSEIEKSKFNFVDSKTKYFEISDEWCDKPSAAFVFDYQVISRNGVTRAYGERDVYINSGEGWEYTGSFEVNEKFSPVRCEMYFEEATVVKAIAVIPTGASAENFISRVNVDKVYYIN